jgi:hypothetical protein
MYMVVTKFLSIPSTMSIAAVGVLILCGALSASAAVLVEDVTLVARSQRYEQVAPQPRSFTVTAAGRYTVTLTDIGFPGPLMSLDLIITRGTQIIERLSRVGTQEFDATPGTYTVHVLGSGTGAGTAGVVIAPSAGGAALLQYQTGIVGNPVAGASNRSSLSTSFTVSDAGAYGVSLRDRNFPVALTAIDLLILNSSGAPIARLCRPAIAGVCAEAPINFNVPAGDYDLFVNATAATTLQSGLYSVSVSGGPSAAVLYSATHPVGVLESHAFIEFPAPGQYSLTLNDLRFPDPLATMSAVLAQGGELLTATSGATTQSFSAVQGQAVLYTMASPATSQGVGAYGVHIPNGTQTLYSDAKAVVGTTAGGARAYVFVGTFPSAGNYRIEARDFAFPTTIPALQLLVTQDGAPLGLGAVPSGGSLTVPARAGQFMIVAIANMLSSTATGLFGVTVDAQPSGTEVLAVTQGIGDIFHARPLTFATAAQVDVNLQDMGFPAPFEDVALVVTRGNSMVGQIFGGGTFSFAATPGPYSLNFVARNATAANYGLYGLKIEDSLPRISFSASALSVPSQGSTTVSWSAPGATSCDASGGWSGARATSGTNVSVGPFAANTTLTLTCVGPGGTASANVSVAVAAVSTPNDSGGAGSLALWQLWVVALLLGANCVYPERLRRR